MDPDPPSTTNDRTVADNGENSSSPSQNLSSFSMRWAKSYPTLVASSTIQYNCLPCKKGFNRKCDLNRHNKKHTRPYKCQDCEKTFASRKDRDRHSNIWFHGQQMNYLCPVLNCLSSTTREDGLYAFGRVDRWRTHMIKEHGLSKEEVRSIVKKGIPMEKKTPKQAAEVNTEDIWGLDDDDLEEDDGWNNITY